MSEEALQSERRRFWLRRLHSLSGVIPVGVFLLFHFVTNAKATVSRHAFDEAVAGIQALPYLLLLEIFLVILPLTFHAVYGVVLSVASRPNVGPYPYNRNWMYFAQRLTGIITFAFVIWHLSHYWVPKLTGELATADFYPALAADLSSTQGGVPYRALGYVAGVAAASFHLANGLWGFCCTWGITVTRRAQRRSATLFGVVGLLVFFLGANTAIVFATGATASPFSLGAPAAAP